MSYDDAVFLTVRSTILHTGIRLSLVARDWLGLGCERRIVDLVRFVK